jgi:hypothetical protein
MYCLNLFKTTHLHCCLYLRDENDAPQHVLRHGVDVLIGVIRRQDLLETLLIPGGLRAGIALTSVGHGDPGSFGVGVVKVEGICLNGVLRVLAVGVEGEGKLVEVPLLDAVQGVVDQGAQLFAAAKLNWLLKSTKTA